MNRQTKARVERLLNDYYENGRGGIVILGDDKRFNITVRGDEDAVILCLVYGIAGFMEQCVSEGKEVDFLTALMAKVYERVLQDRKEKADAIDNQGQSGD